MILSHLELSYFTGLTKEKSATQDILETIHFTVEDSAVSKRRIKERQKNQKDRIEMAAGQRLMLFVYAEVSEELGKLQVHYDALHRGVFNPNTRLYEF